MAKAGKKGRVGGREVGDEARCSWLGAAVRTLTFILGVQDGSGES